MGSGMHFARKANVAGVLVATRARKAKNCRKPKGAIPRVMQSRTAKSGLTPWAV